MTILDLFIQALKKLAFVGRLVWQLGNAFIKIIVTVALQVAVVERIIQESMYGLSAGTKKVAVVES